VPRYQLACCEVTYRLGRGEPCYIMHFDNICSLKVYKIFVRLNLHKKKRKKKTNNIIPVETGKEQRKKFKGHTSLYSLAAVSGWIKLVYLEKKILDQEALHFTIYN